MAEQQIDPYDQQTLDLLVAAGVEETLVERVNRVAKEAAAWKARATEQRETPAEIVIPPPLCLHDTGSTQYWSWPFQIGDWRYRVINKEKRGSRYAYDVHIWWGDSGWVFVVQVDANSPDEGGFVDALEVANTILFEGPAWEDRS
ncbi:hypothetical protein [Kribbella sp. VKM Ac-2568]|uniref:hypothetical protein n=1 Tax=Kribbella sp. VKM Ac-2568 TaxID=2512219 RepID=UPI00104E76AD|nr:hypothetical protein [Kribbella sp. VKM Ac-2568]